MAEKRKEWQGTGLYDRKRVRLSPTGTASHNNILLFTMVKKRTILHRVVVSFKKKYAPKDILFLFSI